MNKEMYTYDIASGAYHIRIAGCDKVFYSFLEAKAFIDGFFDSK